MEVGGDRHLLVATDGSCDNDNYRAGWGYAMFDGTTAIRQDAGAHIAYCSSTRMELETIRRALGSLASDPEAWSKVIFATDSMAVLSRIQAGHLPDGWLAFREAHPACKVTWMYVPGHAGVKCNEVADHLASSCHETTVLELYPADVKLQGTEAWKQELSVAVLQHEEGCRLKSLDIPLGSSSQSHKSGQMRRVNNQLNTGNITAVTLQLLLEDGVVGEKIRVPNIFRDPSL